MGTVSGTKSSAPAKARARPFSSALTSGDIGGGLAAAAVLLPQAMAFGVALYSIAGVNPAHGACAGLLGAVVVCVSSGLAGGTRGLISAPTGPTLVLLGGALVALKKAGIDESQFLSGLALVTVTAGVFQFLIGASGGGRLIKYIPYPVVSGFMLGSAMLMLASQLDVIMPSGTADGWTGLGWMPIAIAGVTIASVIAAPRFVPRLPGPLAGLVAGTLAAHAVAFVRGVPLPEHWVIGALPAVQAPGFSIGDAVTAMPWTIIVSAALALAILASLDTLLTAVVADVTTGERHDARREMIGQGIGQIGAGLAGAMASAGTTAATVVA